MSLKQTGTEFIYPFHFSNSECLDDKVLCNLKGGLGVTEPYDLLIGADGVGSKVREQAFPPSQVVTKYAGWGLYECMIDRPHKVPYDGVVEMW
jgi:2-polyprenyl-6-methoxyphenol hydroxylase-like FAD-dependent oxidoreductase